MTTERKTRIPFGVQITREQLDNAKLVVGTNHPTKTVRIKNGEKYKVERVSNFDGLISTQPLSYVNPVDKFHMMEVAGSGGNKTTGRVYAALDQDNWDGSTLINDPKCEIYERMGPVRREMGHKVVSFGAGGWSTDILGPESIDLDEGLISDCDTKANTLVKSKPGIENFFLSGARALVGGAIAAKCLNHVLHGSKRPTMADMVPILFAPDSEVRGVFRDIVNQMRFEANNSTHSLMVREQANDIAYKLGQAVDIKEPEMWTKVVETVKESLYWLTDSKYRNMVSGVGDKVFRLEEIFADQGDCRPLDIFVNIDPLALRTKGDIASTIVGSVVDVILRYKKRMLNAGGCLAILDEVVRLGNVDAIYKDVELVRGYGLSLWFFIQSIARLDVAVGPGTYDMLAQNCGIISFYGIGPDTEEAKRFSEALGTKAVLTNTASQEQMGTKAKPLMSPNEISGLPWYAMVSMIRGSKQPRIFIKPCYWLRKELFHEIDEKRAAKFAPDAVVAKIQPTESELRSLGQQRAALVDKLFGPAKGDLAALVEQAADWVWATREVRSAWKSEPEMASTSIPTATLFERWTALLEVNSNRPETETEEMNDDFVRYTNRLAAEVAWGLDERNRRRSLAAQFDLEVEDTDFASEFCRSAPRAAEIILGELMDMDEELRLEVMEATKDYPRAQTSLEDIGDLDDGGDLDGDFEEAAADAGVVDFEAEGEMAWDELKD